MCALLLEGYIFLIYIPTDGLCPPQQEKNWCCLCSCSMSLCWFVWLAVFTCVSIHMCFCTLLEAHVQAASGWTSPGLLDPALDTTTLHHLPAVRYILYFTGTVLFTITFSKCVILSTPKIVSNHQICKKSICTVSLAWCKSHNMDILSITDRKLDLMFKHEQPFGRKLAVFPGGVHHPPQILCPFSRAANSWETLSNKEEWGSPAQCRSHSLASLRRIAWGHRASSCQAPPACNGTANPLCSPSMQDLKHSILKYSSVPLFLRSWISVPHMWIFRIC